MRLARHPRRLVFQFAEVAVPEDVFGGGARAHRELMPGTRVAVDPAVGGRRRLSARVYALAR